MPCAVCGQNERKLFYENGEPRAQKMQAEDLEIPWNHTGDCLPGTVLLPGLDSLTV